MKKRMIFSILRCSSTASRYGKCPPRFANSTKFRRHRPEEKDDYGEENSQVRCGISSVRVEISWEKEVCLWIKNNVKVVGTISFGSADELLRDVTLPASFIEQLEYINNVNVSTVAPLLYDLIHRLNLGRGLSLDYFWSTRSSFAKRSSI
jgi:hypothetical protein